MSRPVLRGEGGRYLLGTRGGPGRTDLADRSRYLKAVKAAVTHESLVAVLKTMVIKAVHEGDVAASRLICEYTLGKPAQSITIEAEGGPAYKVLIGVNEAEL